MLSGFSMVFRKGEPTWPKGDAPGLDVSTLSTFPGAREKRAPTNRDGEEAEGDPTLELGSAGVCSEERDRREEGSSGLMALPP